MMDELKLTLGCYDDPENQLQREYCIDLHRTNLAVFGLSMSGKTSLLKMLIMQLHQLVRSPFAEEEVYILDFSDGLSAYQELPLVEGYLRGSQEENIRRIFKVIDEKLAENTKKLKGKTYLQRGAIHVSHITLILDNLNTFMDNEKLTSYHEQLKKIARDGLSKGITIIFTATELSGGIRRMLSSFGRIIALELPKDSYGELFSGRVEKPIIQKGRGVVNIDAKNYEFQAYFPIPEKDSSSAEENAIQEVLWWYYFAGCPFKENGIREEDSLDRVKEKVLNNEANKLLLEKNAKEIEKRNERKIKIFGENLSRNDSWKDYTKMTWAEYVDENSILPAGNDPRIYKYTKGDFTAGLDYYTFKPIKFNLREALTIAIYGKKQFGKSNLLSLILDAARELEEEIELILWDDGRKGLIQSECVSRAISKYDPSWNGNYESTDKIKIVQNGQEFEKLLSEYLEDISLNNKRCEEELIEGVERKEDSIEYIKKAFEESDEFVMAPIYMKKEIEREKNQIKTIKPFTVVVIQSRVFYQSSTIQSEIDHIIPRLAAVIGEAQGKMLFIFSDVQRIAASQLRVQFNNCINHAFLLDDVLKFIKDKGSQSIFGMQDKEEMKERFGPCELGDGFYLNVQADEIQKLKFLKAENE